MKIGDKVSVVGEVEEVRNTKAGVFLYIRIDKAEPFSRLILIKETEVKEV